MKPPTEKQIEMARKHLYEKANVDENKHFGLFGLTAKICAEYVQHLIEAGKIKPTSLDWDD